MTRHGQGDKSIGPAWYWKHIGAVVAVSDAAGDAFRRRYPDQAGKISVIHNGVQLAGVSRDRAAVRAALDLGNQVVGIIAARVDGNKGHDTLLHAMAKLQEQGLPATLLVVGDGAAREPLEALAAERKLGRDRVRFLGFRTDVPDLLAASDFFVLPSLTEGLPLCILEAMASRLPVIATPVGGIPELISDGEHGYLIPVNDIDALAGAIATLAGDASLRQRLGDAGHAKVAEQFSFAEMVRRYDALYRSLLCRRQ
jgi:glycosyltransferase involved in cell wall biosynthesis